MQWIWVLTFSILGSQPEHGQQAKFDSLSACQQALTELRQREAVRGRELVGTCFLRQTAGQGWWQ